MASLLASGLALLLAATVLLLGTPALALSTPWSRSSGESPAGFSGKGLGAAASSLQEVDPPQPVQQLQAALAARQPVVEILSPRYDSALSGAPWTLKLRLHDWPLVDAGPLGIGPHLRVQIDQEPALIWTSLEGTLPPLSPGSHRLTVYAAMPWGEAIKSPGAMQQIRLHRAAANPLSQPAPGTPQLLPVSPSGPAAGEPLLLDWLLLDAPLQNLRGSGSQWRLRAQINGDSVLLDQQMPVWLRGWKPGPNALLLELLDGRGDPLNPPFNSLVLEVNRSASGPRPRWLGDRLSAQELAVLLGQAPPEPDPAAVAASAASAADAAAPERPAAAENKPENKDEGMSQAAPPASISAGAGQTTAELSGPIQSEPTPQPIPAAAEPEIPPPTEAAPASQGRLQANDPSPRGGIERQDALPVPAAVAGPLDKTSTESGQDADSSQPETTSSGLPMAGSSPSSGGADITARARGMVAVPAPTPPIAAAPIPTPPTPTAPVSAAREASTAQAPPLPSQERIAAGSSINGRARDLVNADGTLRQPPAQSPLDKLRGLLQR